MQKFIPFSRFWQLLNRYLLPQRSKALLMAALLLSGIGLQILNPQISRRFVDAVRNPTDNTNLLLLAVLFMVIALTSSILRAAAAYVSNEVAWSATNALRLDLSAHCFSLGMVFHKSRPPGEMIERIDGDVNALSGFFSSLVINFLGNVLLLLGVLITLFIQNWQLGLVFSLYATLSTVFLASTARFSEAWREYRAKEGHYYGFLGEVLAATEDIRGNGAVNWALNRMRQEMKGIYSARLNASIKDSFVWMASIVVWSVADILSYGFGAKLYSSGILTIGAVYMLMHYAWMIAEPIQNFRQQLQQLQRAEASIKRVEELFNTKASITSGTQNLPLEPLAVAFEGVSFAYEDEVLVLKGVNWCLPAGSVLGVLGRTGSGKTTLARLLFRFYDPACGVVRLQGRDLRDYDLLFLRAGIAMVTQDVQLFQGSLRDNLSFFDKSVADTRLLDVLARLGLRDWLEALPDGLSTMVNAATFSAGEAQLIALARAFLQDPQLVILDEASARLDPATEARLEVALDTLLHGRTTIIIAHRLGTVERASHILVMQAGEVLEFARRETLLANPESQFYKLRKTGLEELLV